eukprot:350866-Pyramimonas_sp.AAC.1
MRHYCSCRFPPIRLLPTFGSRCSPVRVVSIADSTYRFDSGCFCRKEVESARAFARKLPARGRAEARSLPLHCAALAARVGHL